MTSPLGSYIYKTQHHYFQWGVYGYFRKSKENFSKEASLMDSLTAQKNKNEERLTILKNSVDKKTLSKLETRIRALAKKENFSQKEKERKIKINQLQLLIENFLISQNKNKKDFSLGDLSSLKDDDFKRIQQLRKNILNNIKTINSKNQNSMINSRTLSALNKNIEEFSNILKITNFKLGKFSISNIDKNQLNAVEELIKNATLSNICETATWGPFGEQITAAIDDSAYEVAQKELQKAINSVQDKIKGANISSFSITENQIPKEIATLMEDGDALYRVYSTQDKVDVSIKIKEKPVDISVKTYTSTKNNKIYASLQEVNLIYSLLSTEGSFGKHWLNLHSLGLHNFMHPINEEFEKQIKYEALASGNLLKQAGGIGPNSANVFVAIDVQNGQVFVKDAYTLLTQNKENFFISPELNSISFLQYNSLSATWQHRVAKILSEVRKTKLKVSLKVNFSTENKNLTS